MTDVRSAAEAGDQAERSRVVVGAVQAARRDGFVNLDYFSVARAANVEVWRVKQLFPTWESLVVAAASHWIGAARRQSRVIAETRGAVAYLRHLLRLSQLDPAMMRARVHLMSVACNARGTEDDWYREQYAHLMQDVAQFLGRDMIAGREPRSMAPRHAAKQLTALYDGLQLQYLLTDEPDLLGTWDRAVARMRSGWSSEYTEPTS
ncbi:TetR family transcriptional regulator C-terminal domain-containing protein [Curtobacterium sp. ME26]|uniref:TetR family transcriptional regulator C-terminal domain-containing protein n=1 Tax=Curtobacterium sp. ME26 TaxID=2744254 RepID=UPI0015F5F6D2|nr:TetR family transcriptional regulator C-terminal domain-containing protein [Curtobacterium sp. ME26]